MAKLVNESFEGVNVGIGIATLRFKNPIKSFASIARRLNRMNDSVISPQSKMALITRKKTRTASGAALVESHPFDLVRAS
ncbi:hypothetical protein [Alicyclobacillus sp. SO9]|uniref:hypothetical protein n=1 Tax=Alicyclobacillus sp. SO9 TaxID=2665646 RepID=UPI0018E79E2A|nr:hypothetical protein [Alicyclobacillus sp. SO9]QQE81609.1 hypothetical protein GI364_24765 [Alicyclobacillus sp. SO9]